MISKKQKQKSQLIAIITAITLIVWPFSTGATITASSFAYPIKNYQVVSDFGDDRGGIYHLGEDAMGPAGTAVYSISSGYVKHIGEHTRFGTVILIEHSLRSGSKAVSLYGHLRSPDVEVSEGQFVNKGQVIGYLGNPEENGGWSEHIHFAIRRGAYVDVNNHWVYWGLNRSKSEMDNWYDPSDFINGTSAVSHDPENAGKIITGAGVGGNAHIRTFKASGAAIKSADFFAFSDTFMGGADVAVGDIDADGTQEIVVGAGPGSKPYVKVFDKDTQLLENFFLAYGENFRGGVRVAVGNINGGKYQEIITGAGSGGGAHVRTFTIDGEVIHPKLFPFGESQSTGVDVAAGDVDGDGLDEIIAAAGSGGKPEIKIIDRDGTAKKIDIVAFPKHFRGGTRVATGDVDGDGVDEIIVGAGAGGGPHVRVFEGNGDPRPIQMFPFHHNFRGGVDVTSYDYNSDGKDDIIASQASHGQAWVKVMKYNNQHTILAEFNAYAAFEGGTNITAIK